MGAVRIEMYNKSSQYAAYPGAVKTGMPLVVALETSSTTATVAGSRIQAPSTSGKMWASITVDEDCYVGIGVDPTAKATAASDGTGSYLLKANVAREFPVQPGDKFSFKDVA